MSSLDLLGDIPRGERVLLKLFLRNPILSKDELAEQSKNLKEKKGLSEKEVISSLQALIERGWVSVNEESYVLMQQKSRGSKTRG